MGEVYEVEDTKEKARVALKALSAELLRQNQFVRRFVREVRTAKEVAHPNVCRVYHLSDDKTFYTMEFVAGVSLASHLREVGQLPLDRALRLLVPIASGLDAIHHAGITHRDFKPENILLTAGTYLPKITDFGLARFNPQRGVVDSIITDHTKWLLGTLPYMAPEQVRGEEATPASDIWAFGVLLCLLTTGTNPFRHETRGATEDAILGKTPLPADAFSTLPEEWQDALKACLQRDSSKRPDRATSVLDMLTRTKPFAIQVSPSILHDLRPASDTAHELDIRLRAVERSSADRRAADAISALRALGLIADNVARGDDTDRSRVQATLSQLNSTLALVDPAPSDTQIEWLYNDAMALCEAIASVAGQLHPTDDNLVRSAASTAESVAAAFARWRNWIENTYDNTLSPVVNRHHPRLPDRANERPRLYIVSGPSAAGKDTIISEVIPRLLERGIRADCLAKYSTRHLRPQETPLTTPSVIPGRLEYQRQLDPAEFERRVSDGRLIISYSKYGNQYAFGADSLSPYGDPVRFCIFSEFTRVDSAVTEFERGGVTAVPILVLARPDEMERRMYRRGLDHDDARRRISEMRADYKFIMSNKERMRNLYPLVTWNEHPATLEDAVTKVVHFVMQTVSWSSANV